MNRTYGAVVRSIASRVCDQDTLEQVIEPTLADLQCECAEMTRDSVARSRWWLHLTVSIALVEAVVLCSFDRMARARSAPPSLDEARALTTTTLISTLATAVALAVFVLPPLLHVPHVHWRMILYLVPQALPVALPIGVTVGVLAGVREARASRRIAARLTLLAMVCSVASFIVFGWVVPDANQAFREFAFAQTSGAIGAGQPPRIHLARGANELTIVELREQARGASLRERPGRLRAFAYYQRWALSAATLAMVLFALAAVHKWRFGWAVGSCVAVTSCTVYWALMDAGRSFALNGTWRPGPGAWLPNVFFAIAAALIAAASFVQTKHRPCSAFSQPTTST